MGFYKKKITFSILILLFACSGLYNASHNENVRGVNLRRARTNKIVHISA